MRKYLLIVASLCAATVLASLSVDREGLSVCSDDELASVTGGIFTECDGASPCEVFCHGSPSHIYIFEYNNGAITCGSPALENCGNNVAVQCQRRFFNDSQCLSWTGLSDSYETRAACSVGVFIQPIPYP